MKINSFVNIGKSLFSRLGKNTAAELFVICSRRSSLNWAEKKLENWGKKNQMGVGLRIIKDKRAGFAFSNDSSAQGIEQLSEQAEKNCGFSAVDEANILPCPSSLLSGKCFFDQEMFLIPVKQKLELLSGTESLVLGKFPKIKKVIDAVYQEEEWEVYLANSQGLERSSRGTSCSFGFYCLAGDKGELQMGGEFAAKRYFADLNWRDVALSAAEKSVRLLGARRIKSQVLPIILNPEVAGEFWGLVGNWVCADRIQKNRSPFRNKLGEMVASPLLSFVDDGNLENGLATVPFDGEGVPARRTPVIADGYLKSFLYDTKTAKKDNVSSTGNAERLYQTTPQPNLTNFYLEKGESTRGDLISGIAEGLLVQEVMGLHTVDPISGDFSLGVSGYLIEQGEISYPVRGITLAGNLLQLLNAVDGIADDLTFHGPLGSPTVRIREAQVGGE